MDVHFIKLALKFTLQFPFKSWKPCIAYCIENVFLSIFLYLHTCISQIFLNNAPADKCYIYQLNMCLLGWYEPWLPFPRLKSKQCQFDVLPSRTFKELNTLMVLRCKNLIVKWVSSPPASASICCWAEAQPAACLSQHVLKLAGEEVLSCANYILIIGNVLANQALIAISESASSSRVKGLSALAKTCWAFSFHRR